jgi:hypothetical protein
VILLHRTTVGSVRGFLEAGCKNVYELFKSVIETKVGLALFTALFCRQNTD